MFAVVNSRVQKNQSSSLRTLSNVSSRRKHQVRFMTPARKRWALGRNTKFGVWERQARILAANGPLSAIYPTLQNPSKIYYVETMRLACWSVFDILMVSPITIPKISYTMSRVSLSVVAQFF